MKTRIALLATLLLGLVELVACAPSGERIPQGRTDRIRRELGLTPPFRLLSAAFVLDGGSAISGFVDGRGDSLWVLIDGRMRPLEGATSDEPRERHVHIGKVGWDRRFPSSFDVDWEASRPLEFESAPESAVVDLFAWTIRSLVPAERESAWVRESRSSTTTTAKRPEFSSADEENAWKLRRMIDRIEGIRWLARGLRHSSRGSIRDHLGLEMPIRLLHANVIDDGGSVVIGVVDAVGESMSIFRDNSLVRVPPRGTPFKPPRRFTYLNGTPGAPGAQRLESGSAQESAAVAVLQWLGESPTTDPSDTALVLGVARTIVRTRIEPSK